MTTPSRRRWFRSLGLLACAAAGVAPAGCHRSEDDTSGPRSPGPVNPIQAGLAAAPRVEPLKVTSPNGEVEFAVVGWPDEAHGDPPLRYRVTFRGRPVIVDSGLGLELAGQPRLPSAPRQTGVRRASADEVYGVPAGKSSAVRNHYNAATVEYVEVSGRQRRLDLEIRAFDDGVAFRYVLPGQDTLGAFQITRERTEFRFARDGTAYPIILSGFGSPYEDEYQKRQVSGLHPEWLIGVPLLVEVPGVVWAAVTEADIEDYAGMYLRRSAAPLGLETHLAPRRDRPEAAVLGTTPAASPWRVVMLGREPGRLVESDILLNLNPPSMIGDTSWIRAGKTAWNWWSGTYAEGVPFSPGMNTETVKHYIDFAADSGFPYMLIDEGWALRRGGQFQDDDLLAVNPSLDMPEVLRHCRARNVRLWLWAHWVSVQRQMDEAFALFERWGIAGVKVDFMDRDDQWMVNWYRQLLKTAARYHLMVDLHGAYKPDGVERTYPNLMTREAVMGTEYLKWSARVTPEYDCTLPFTRMLAGPLDYCPGGFLNATRDGFEAREMRPMVLGTRAHQLALYVVLQSHLQMVSDYPERYKGQEDFRFIRDVPASWDETRVLAGWPTEFIAVARRSGDDWFVGCLTNWSPRRLTLPLDFLGAGGYVSDIYADAPDAGEHPTHTGIHRRNVDRATRLELELASGGGAAIRIRPGRAPAAPSG